MGETIPSDERGRLLTIDRPTDHASTERVENNGAVLLALASRVFSDVGDPELIATFSPELTLYVIPGGRDVRHI